MSKETIEAAAEIAKAQEAIAKAAQALLRLKLEEVARG